jgi:hypothetical protein
LQEFILIGLLGKMVVFPGEEIREQLPGMTGVMKKNHFRIFRGSKKIKNFLDKEDRV